MSPVLARLSDARAQQFWDKRHELAQRLAADARDPQPKPDCCVRDGFLWDMAAVYPAGAVWAETLPPAIFFDGPVAEVRPQLELALSSR